MYAYAGDDPVDFADPEGLWGVGIIGGASYEAGRGLSAVGGSISAGYGYFSGGGLGAFGSSGSFGPGPGGQRLSPPSPGSSASAFGGYGGFGGGFFITNADTVDQLGAAFRTYSLSFGWGKNGMTFQVSVGQEAKGRNLIWEGAWMRLGYGFGASARASNTNTVTINENNPVAQIPVSAFRPAAFVFRPGVGALPGIGLPFILWNGSLPPNLSPYSFLP
jgi:hypothetical protein